MSDTKYKYFIGLDEVGRGALAGPVYAAAVLSKSLKKIFNPFNKFRASSYLIRDSKKLTENQRENWYKFLNKKFIWGLGKVSEKTIDKIGIEKANFLAMEKALSNLTKKKRINLKKTLLLIDGNRINNYKLKAISYKLIIKGDEKIPIIAAASILAKVSRDKFMEKLHFKYPRYNWIKNKGYGTKIHFKTIKKSGVTSFHRKSFLKNTNPRLISRGR